MLALVVCAQFMITIDVSIVNVALPSIGVALHLSRVGLSWVVNAYSLAFGGLLLLGGRLADLLGRRRMFTAGLVVFSFASLAGGLAPSPAWLLAARAVQGGGAAVIAPATLSIITTTFAEGPPGTGPWACGARSPGSAAPPGCCSAASSPAAWAGDGCCSSTSPSAWPPSPPRPDCSMPTAPPPAPVPSMRPAPWPAPPDSACSSTAPPRPRVPAGAGQTLGCLAGALTLLAVFLIIESRQPQPLLPLSLLRIASVRAANLTRLLNAAYLYAMFYFVSLYLQQILGQSPLQAGLSYLPLALAIFAAARLAGRLITTTGTRPPLIAGLLLSTAGLLWFSTSPHTAARSPPTCSARPDRRHRDRAHPRPRHDRRDGRRRLPPVRRRVRTGQRQPADRRRPRPRRPRSLAAGRAHTHHPATTPAALTSGFHSPPDRRRHRRHRGPHRHRPQPRARTEQPTPGPQTHHARHPPRSVKQPMPDPTVQERVTGAESTADRPADPAGGAGLGDAGAPAAGPQRTGDGRHRVRGRAVTHLVQAPLAAGADEPIRSRIRSATTPRGVVPSGRHRTPTRWCPDGDAPREPDPADPA